MSYMRSAERRNQILDNAVGVFAQKGYEQASITNICEASGIARGTLYQYFPNKNRLFRTVLEEYAQKLTTEMQPFRSMGIPPPRTFAELEAAVTMRLISIFRILDADRNVYQLLLKEAMAKNAETEDVVRAIREQFVSLIEEDIRDASALGVVDVEDPHFTAVCILGTLFNICLTFQLDQTEPPGADWLGHKAARWVLRGLAANCGC